MEFSNLAKLLIIIFLGTLWTFISFSLGVKAKISPIATALIGESKIESQPTIWMFILALIAQIIPFWFCRIPGESRTDALTILTLSSVIILLWISAKNITIEFPERIWEEKSKEE